MPSMPGSPSALLQGIVLFGDVAGSRRDAAAAAAWLRRLVAELNDAFGSERLARFEFTQGDEIQGLLAPTADPFAVVLRASLAGRARPMRWVVVAGEIEPGRGPATQRTGPAFLAARAAVERARARREGLTVVSGHGPTDQLLADVAPSLAALLADLTDRQREIGRLVVVEGLRRAEAAERLGISRPTVSVAADRARLREIAGLARALAAILRDGLGRPADRSAA